MKDPYVIPDGFEEKCGVFYLKGTHPMLGQAVQENAEWERLRAKRCAKQAEAEKQEEAKKHEGV